MGITQYKLKFLQIFGANLGASLKFFAKFGAILGANANFSAKFGINLSENSNKILSANLKGKSKHFDTFALNLSVNSPINSHLATFCTQGVREFKELK